jgi:hypothetical protein
VQIADSRVQFGGSPCPGGRALTRPVETFHILVVSRPGVFHKGHRSRSCRGSHTDAGVAWAATLILQ